MKLLYRLWNILPSFVQNIIKYIYMKWSIQWSMIKIVPLTWLIKWMYKIGKKARAQGWNDFHILWKFEIWDYSTLNSWLIVYSSDEYTVKIWKFCSIGSWTAFIASMNHNYHYLTTYTRILDQKKFQNLWKSIILHNDIRVWKNVIILKWVTIWTWAIIWAWAVVTKDIPPYAIAVWNPAKVIKYRFNDKIIQKLLESERWDWDIEKIKKNYHLEFIK